MKNQKIYSVIVSLIPAIQAVLDTFNAANVSDHMRMYIGGALIFLIIVLQGIQIYFNPEIKNKAIWVSIVALIGYIAGGMIDNLNLISLSEETSSIIRLAFSLVVVFANTIAKEYNTVNTGLKINLK